MPQTTTRKKAYMAEYRRKTRAKRNQKKIAARALAALGENAKRAVIANAKAGGTHSLTLYPAPNANGKIRTGPDQKVEALARRYLKERTGKAQVQPEIEPAEDASRVPSRAGGW
jgi:hypothetical protein